MGRIKKLPFRRPSKGDSLSLLVPMIEQQSTTKTAGNATLVAVFDELEKISQEVGAQPSPPAFGGSPNTMGLPGGAGSPPPQEPASLVGSKNFGANKPTPAEPADVISGAKGGGQRSNNFAKMGGIPMEILARGATGVATKAVQSPGMAYWRFKQQKKGLSKHKQTMLALKHGYPAGWVGMNMRPG